MYCKKCGKENKLDYKYCKNCGEELDTDWIKQYSRSIFTKTKLPKHITLKRLFILSIVVFILFGEVISDQIFLATYNPNYEIARITNNLNLTREGKLLFYRANPKVIDRSKVKKHCGKDWKNTITQGCYVDGRIFIMKIYDNNFKKSMDVTAAHELLHAAYNQLDNNEQKEVTSLVKSNPKNAEVKEKLKNYDNNQISKNYETHAFIGTEQRNVSVELEQHYNRYFKSRTSIVAIDNNIDKRIKTAKTKLRDLEKQLNSYDRNLSEIENQIYYCRSIGSISCYNANVSIYNRQLEKRNKKARQYNKQLKLVKAISQSIQGKINLKESSIN